MKLVSAAVAMLMSSVSAWDYANRGADWVDSWMDYMVRLDKEAQGMFANGCSAEKYAHRKIVMTNKKFTQWAMDNNYMFAADKK